MVKIRKGNLTAIVPLSTFKNHYEKLGWKAKLPKSKLNVDEEPNDEEPRDEIPQEDDDETSAEDVDLLSMNLEQLRKFAAQNEIDISNANSKKEIRVIIEAALGE